MEELKKNDFFATIVKNQDVSLSDLRNNGITSDNSELLSENEYKNIPQVQEAFKGVNGEFDEKKFKESYNIAKTLYTNFAEDDFLGNMMENFTYSSDAWFAPKDSNIRNDSPIILTKQRPIDVTQGISYITEMGEAVPQLSIREQAQKEKVVDFETGETLDFSPNDKAGLFSRYTLPTLVLAQWDEDGTHFENGVEIQHKAGDLKLNENYKPYYETLGKREIYNKEVLKNSDILTVDGSGWNKLDFFDSDDIEKPGYKVALNLVANIAPMFIPVVGEIYGYIGAATELMKVAPMLGKTINGIITGDNSNSVGTALSSFEGYMNRFGSTQSDYAREHLFSFEGIGNMISDVSKQLFQQRAVSTIPTIFAKARGVTDYKKVAEIGRGLSLSYMAATSAQDIYGDFKNAGASDRVAGFATLGSMLSLYKLMSIDYFRDNILKDTFMDESEVREALRGASRATRDKFRPYIVEEGTELATKTGAAKLVKKISDFYTDTLVPSLQKKGVAGLISRGLSEGVEEVMEEVTTDSVKGVVEALNALGINVTEEKKELDFGWSGKDFLERYGTSFVGGFIGGQIFAAQGRYEKWLNSKLKGLPNINPTDMQKLVYYVASGRRSEIDSYLDKWHEKGLLGSENLSIDSTTKVEANRSDEFIPSTKGISQNEAVYNVIKHTLDVIQNSVEAEVPDIRNMLSSEGLDNLRAMGYNDSEVLNNPKLITASTIAALGDYSSLENDLFKTLSDIVIKKGEIEARVNELSTTRASTEDERRAQAENINNDPTINKLKEELASLREKKNKILEGKQNKYYSGQSYFAANKYLQAPFIDISLENFTKLKYGRNFESFNDEQKNKIREEHSKYSNTEGRNKIYRAFDLYLDLSSKYASIIQNHGETLEKALSENDNIPSILGISDFINASEEYNTLKAEKLSIESIGEESRTPEQIARLGEINSSMSDLLNKFSIILRNPELALIVPEDRNIVDTFTGTVSPNTNKISIYDDMSAGMIAATSNTKIDSALTLDILNSLKEDYEKRIAEGRYRFDDNELTAILRGIATSYRAAGGAKARFYKYQTDSTTGAIPGYIGEHLDEDGNIYDDQISDDISRKIEKEGYGAWFYGGGLYKNDIINEANEYMRNIGIDNTAAQSHLNKIYELLAEHTNLMTPENSRYLKDFMDYMLPTINKKSIVDIVGEFDNLRSQSKYVPFLELMESIGTDVDDLNLLKLIEEESKRLSNQQNLEEYLIRNDKVKSSLNVEKLKKTLGVALAVIYGASDGTNDIMNNFKKVSSDDTSIPVLATMSKKASDNFRKQKEVIEGKISFLNLLAERNNTRSLRIHKDTAISMRPKFIKSLLGLGESFKKVFGVDIQDLWNSITDNSNTDPTEETFSNWEQNVIKFEDKLYSLIGIDPNNENEVEELSNKLLSLFNISTLFKSKSTNLTDRKEEVIGEIDLLYYISTLASLPSEKFYSAYSNTITQYNKDHQNSPIIPVYGQEYATKQIIAQIINPKLFNTLIDKIQDNADFSKYSKEVKSYLSHKSRLHNLGVILGSAGSGKTIGVIKTILNTIKGSSPINVAYIAREKNQAEKVARSAGSDSNYWTVDEYCKEIFGEEVSSYIYMDGGNEDSISKHFIAESAYEYKGSDTIFNSSDLKILVIDEIETLTEPELTRICNDAEKRGIFVIGAGDLKQPGIRIKGKNLEGKEVSVSSGLEDCVFVKTPTLTTSMRPQTVAKVENTILLSNALNSVLEEVENDPSIDLTKRAGLVSQNLKDSKLYYWEDTSTGEVFGDMGVDSQETFIEKISQLSKLEGTVAIITDNPSKYDKYKSDKVEVVPYEKRAGGEWDYVLVDVDFAKHNSTGSLNAFLLAQDFYTLTQRSRLGTVIKTSAVTNMFIFESNKSKKQIISPDKNQFKEFEEWRNKSLENIVENPEVLKDYFSNSPLMRVPITRKDQSQKPLTNPTNIPANNSYSPNNQEQAQTSQQQQDSTASTTLPPASTSVQPPLPGGIAQSEETEDNSRSTQNQDQSSSIPSTPQLPPPTTLPPPPKPSSSPRKFRYDDYINKLFLTNPNTITTGKEFWYAVSGAFKNIRPTINEVLRSNKHLTESLPPNTALVNDIKNIIESKYGRNGADLFTSIVDNFGGFNPEEGRKILDSINNLKIVTSKLSDHGKLRSKVYDEITGEWVPASFNGDREVCLGIYVGKLLLGNFNSEPFYSWAEKQGNTIDSFHSISKLGINFIRNKDNDELAKTMIMLGSYVRTGNYSSNNIQSILRFILNSNTLSSLSNFRGGETKLWVVPGVTISTIEQDLLVSRHYSKDGSVFFDIPLLTMEKTPSSIYGEFTGVIEMYDKLNLGKDPDNYYSTLDDLNIFVNKRIGVVKISKDEVKEGVEDVNEKTSTFLQNNNGKVFAAVTDEPSIAQIYFNKSGYGIYSTDFDLGNSVKAYDNIALTGIQCRITSEEFIDAIQRYMIISGLDKNLLSDYSNYKQYRFRQGRFSNPNDELDETISSNEFTSVEFLKTDTGKIRQLLPWGRSGRLLSISMMSLKDSAFRVAGFLNSIGGSNTHTMILQSEDLKSTIEVGIIDGEYRVGTYNPEKGFIVTNDPKLSQVRVKAYATTESFIELFTSLYGNTIKSNPPIVHFRNYYKSSKNGETKYSYRDFSSNWELSLLLCDINTPEKIEEFDRAVKSYGNVHGIFLDDHILVDPNATDTHWGILDAGNRVYETDHNYVSEWTRYVINVNNNIIPTVESKQIKPLQQFIDENNLGIKADSIEEANKQLADKSLDWIYPVIESDDSGNYSINSTTDDNFFNWVMDRFGIPIDRPDLAIIDFKNLKTSSPWIIVDDVTPGDTKWMFTYNNGYKVKGISQELNSSIEELIESVDSSSVENAEEIIINNYIKNRVFKHPYQFNSVLDIINNDLNIAEKIINFEDQFDC